MSGLQLLKNREEALTAKTTSKTKEHKRSKYKTDEVESMDKVQMLGEAFQKIQAATGIKVSHCSEHMSAPLCPIVCAQSICSNVQLSPSFPSWRAFGHS